MEKLDCIEDYFAGTRAYYLFLIGMFENKPEYLDFILDKKYLNGAKVACVSNVMLGIKEDLVDTKGAMDYQSKVFLKALERSVDMIATKVPGGYKLSNYVFPDAATLVAILRNKLAHGKYKFDFDHNRVILEHKGVDIIINIDNLVTFVMAGLLNRIRDVSTTKYERNIVYLQKKEESIEKGKIRDNSDIKKIIKSYNCAKFKIESKTDMPILPEYITYFNNFLKQFREEPYDSLKSDNYKKLKLFFEKNGYEISMEYFKLDNAEDINEIVNFVSETGVNNSNLSYLQQIKFIGEEIQRKLDSQVHKLSSTIADSRNLFLIDAISKTRTVNKEILFNHIEEKLGRDCRFSYDEYGMSLISMFNSLCMYPFDDVFGTSGEYTVNREGLFDFANLDLSMVNPIVCNIDESPLNNLAVRLNALSKQQNDIVNKLNIQQNNLNKVMGKPDAFNRIKTNIADLKNTLSVLISEYVKVDGEYNTVKNDFVANNLHFKNRAIIEGIRNAIAHGNYEFNINGNVLDTEIVFNDIYEGNNTFQLKISFGDFEEMINKNYEVILNYIRGKKQQKNR